MSHISSTVRTPSEAIPHCSRKLPKSSHFGLKEILLTTALIAGAVQLPAQAETTLKCDAPGGLGASLLNEASANYSDGFGRSYNTVSQQVSSQLATNGTLSLKQQGIKDKDGKLIYGVGTAAHAIRKQLIQLGFTDEDALRSSVSAIQAFVSLPDNASLQQAIAATKTAILQSTPNQADNISRAGATVDENLALSLMGLGDAALENIGITTTERTTLRQGAIATLNANPATNPLNQIAALTVDSAIKAVPSKAELLTAASQSYSADLVAMKAKQNTPARVGDIMRFEYGMSNPGTAPIVIQLPTIEELQQSGMTGSAKVIGVSTEQPGATSVTIAPGQTVKLFVDVQLTEVSKAGSVLTLALGHNCDRTRTSESVSEGIVLLPPISTTLIDPFGRITGCNGELLPDYRGFSVGLYRSTSSTGEIGSILRLPQTEVPDVPNNNVPAGLEPNDENTNPFFLVNADEGKYNFLMAPNQLRKGAVYILVVKPPEDSNYDERRIKIEIGDRTPEGFAYRATSLDGRPISASDRQNSVTGTLKVSEATQVGLILALVDLDTGVCQSEAIQIVKTGDRVTAQPGDTIVYRLQVRNLSTTAIENLTVTDVLPLGFRLVDDSTRGAIQGRSTAITTTQEGSTVTFRLRNPLPEDAVANIVYATQLTPDAIRGNGQNSATARGQRQDNDWVVRDGPALHRLRIDPGLLSDCGTIIGRVFEDKNFDGEQQPGEPGIPNAVIFLDDGNRITTDEDGLFSVQNVLNGNRVGTLDLTSLPGYTLAQNTRFIERNSPSRLVRLEPGGLVRMNFAVTPTFKEEAGQ
jgi:uncharacterized repeat protein (TIGR01451 family)